MDEVSFLKMDLFFAVTTAVVVFVGILASLALYFLVKILQDLRDITRTVRREAEGIASDLDAVRAEVREGVKDVRDNVTAGLKTARAYGGAFAGARIVRGLASLLETFTDPDVPERPRARRRRRSKEER